MICQPEGSGLALSTCVCLASLIRLNSEHLITLFRAKQTVPAYSLPGCTCLWLGFGPVWIPRLKKQALDISEKKASTCIEKKQALALRKASTFKTCSRAGVAFFVRTRPGFTAFTGFTLLLQDPDYGIYLVYGIYLASRLLP